MRNFYFTVALAAGFSVAAQAQSSKSTSTAGTNPNPDAPVNVSDPSLRPANPAMYSSTPAGNQQPGQFYVKDDKPAYSNGELMVVPTGPQPSKEEMMRKAASTKATPATKTKASPAAGNKTAPKKSVK